MDSEKEGDIERAREREVKRLSTERPATYHDVVASILAETVALKGIWHGKFRMFNRALYFTTTATVRMVLTCLARMSTGFKAPHPPIRVVKRFSMR